jgi:MurNAc alpha-1-phosphate uridylyltransferase
MQAIILAAGRGSRLMPLTQDTPKPLIKVHGKALIEHNIERLKSAGITNIVINLHYLGEKIQYHLGDGKVLGVQITYSFEPKVLETAGGIIYALPLLKNAPFMVINSDILCDYDLTKLKLPSDKLMHLVLVNNPEHNPDGDFTFAKSRLTFSGIGIYHPALFAPYPINKKLTLGTVFQTALSEGKISFEHHTGAWQDIGSISRLNLANQMSNSR